MATTALNACKEDTVFGIGRVLDGSFGLVWAYAKSGKVEQSRNIQIEIMADGQSYFFSTKALEELLHRWITPGHSLIQLTLISINAPRQKTIRLIV
jgi:hypothetical protein